MSQTHRGIPCHHGCGCDIRHLVKSAEHGPEREPEHLDNGEMRMLLRAAREVAELVGHNREQLAAARARTIDAHARTEEALQSLARFDATASLRTTRVAHEAVESRHAEDGAHDRRRRHLWIRALRWPVIAAMALFDAWYFMRVFQYLTTSEETVSPAEQTVSFLPGVVLALALMLSGHAIAAPLHRVREWLHDLPEPVLTTITSLTAMSLTVVLVSVLLGSAGEVATWQISWAGGTSSRRWIARWAR